MTRDEFVEKIQDEISLSGAIPVQLPEKRVQKVIDNSLAWFYDHYRDSVETRNFLLPMNLFSGSAFIKDRAIVLPKCVFSVYDCKEINGGSRIGRLDFDLSDRKFMAAEVMLNPGQSDGLVSNVIAQSYWDLTKAFFLETIAVEFNKNTSRLVFRGRTPKRDVAITTYVKLEDSDMFNDYYFYRFVTASCKVSLGEMLSFFDYKLPGDIAINASDIKSSGQEELDKIIEEIDGQNTADWFFQYH